MLDFLPRWTVILLLCLVVRCHAKAFAQFSGATVTGVVQDSSRAVIPQAKLKLINTQTGTENDSISDREGAFLLAGVLAGNYTLQVESSGFATTQVRGITLAAGDTKSLLIRMKVGSLAETVNVDASGLVMNTTTAAVEVVADRKLVENLTLNGRSFPDLIALAPGIVTQNPQAGGRGNSTVGEFSVNGQLPGSNSFFVDGVAANVGLGSASGASRLASTGSIAGTTAVGTTQTLVSVDALEEFRVLTSTYSAEYGRTPGGQFNFVTRSGANGFHGSAYEYYRRDALDAWDYFQKQLNDRNFNQYDSGATIGGPLALPWAASSDHKSYAFGSYEWLAVAQPTPQLFEYGPSYTVYHDAPLEIAPIINAFGPFGDDIVNADGQATGMGYGQIGGVALPSHVYATSIRFDQILNRRSSFFVRYADTPSFGQTEQLTALSQDRVHSQTLTLGLANQLAEGKSNQFWLGYARNNSNLKTNIEPYFPTPLIVNLVSLLGVPPSYGSVRGQVYLHINGAGDSLIQTDQASSSLTQWNLRDTVVLPMRNHLFKIGFDERRLSSTVTPTSLLVQADFFDRASMVQNSVSQLIVSHSTPASPQVQELSAFADDTWKVSNTLNLSLGLVGN